MMAPAVLWPALLGLSFLAAGILAYRRELQAAVSLEAFGFVALGPTFVAASLAAFAGEHFTAGRSLAELVPRWMPARLFIAYFVGVAHLAAAASFVARRCVRWSSVLLAIMFALFVLLMDLPAAVARPGIRIFWILAAREATFAMGALALFASESRDRWPRLSNRLAEVIRVWTAGVLVFYGIDHLLHPQYSAGVPSTTLTAAWVPLPHAISYVTGMLLVAFGVAMCFRKRARAAGALGGVLMVMLTLALYFPELFLSRGVGPQVYAINFVADTLLFAGMMFLTARAVSETTGSRPAVRSEVEPRLSDVKMRG